ncbi:hypothetical protein V5E97_33570 [Singulisphaera sp. Ch08]|uniref:Lipoprotein n=1 Tax=Singulisphaera sp. Ch08 TaxID=3120278 RepID=A0AAU7CDP2_9BACT
MIRREMIIYLAIIFISGCTDAGQAKNDQPTESSQRQDRVTLKKPIGIATVAGDFTPLVDAGQRLPYTRSETFTNKTDGGSEALVELSQKDESGIETIASLIIAIPSVADNALQITVTLKISKDKKMRVKTTVVQTANMQEFGPFSVE